MPTPAIPASTLFDEKDIKLYVRWQRSNPGLPQERYGTLPTAFEYQEYMYWRDHLRWSHLPRVAGLNFIGLNEVLAATGREQNPAYNRFTQATTCHHPLHPAHPVVIAAGKSTEHDDQLIALLCPFCMIQVHLDLLNALEKRFIILGGPWKSEPGVDVQQYSRTNASCHRAKLDLIKTVYNFEAWAEAECMWENLHLDQDVDVVKQFDARQALKLWRGENINPALLEGEASSQLTLVADTGKEATPVSNKGKKSRKVSFQFGTPEDTKHRSNALFSRSCPTYDPASTHSCPDTDGWYDTSFLRDYHYSIRQCRILCMDQDTVLPYITYHDLNSGPDRGENVHVERLIGLVEGWLANESAHDRSLWQQYLARSGGMFVVQKQDETNGDDFDWFTIVETLAGTTLEEHARNVGDLDEEDEAKEAEEEAAASPEDLIEDVDGWDQDSLASEDEDEEPDEEDTVTKTSMGVTVVESEDVEMRDASGIASEVD
ncbi:hypothetical protein BDV95DRAFT_245254 [Massariosphaeria phaeospora]|uniref:Uncharacterized protein n=1 Tax=Massariosphaeria phaeospora TaxID=100035 RepID=A0A7C8M312_9PLEO|nr:hypothetical protein BDV95DRAFT_245254 [Massariosphaeria phaeospora]